MRKVFLPVVLSIVACAASSFAALAEDKPITLSRTLKAGQVIRYKASSTFTINMNGSDAEGTVTDTERTTVKEVKDGGDLVLEVVSEGAHITVAGMEIDRPMGDPVLHTHDKQGKLTKIGAPPEGTITSPEVTHLLAIFNWTIFPEKPVKPGDSWEAEFDNPAVKGKKVTVKTTFVGIEKGDKADLWKIKSVATAESGVDNGKIEHENVSWIDPAQGVAVKYETTQKNVPTMYGLFTSTRKAELVKEDKK